MSTGGSLDAATFKSEVLCWWRRKREDESHHQTRNKPLFSDPKLSTCLQGLNLLFVQSYILSTILKNFGFIFLGTKQSFSIQLFACVFCCFLFDNPTWISRCLVIRTCHWIRSRVTVACRICSQLTRFWEKSPFLSVCFHSTEENGGPHFLRSGVLPWNKVCNHGPSRNLRLLSWMWEKKLK